MKLPGSVQFYAGLRDEVRTWKERIPLKNLLVLTIGRYARAGRASDLDIGIVHCQMWLMDMRQKVTRLDNRGVGKSHAID